MYTRLQPILRMHDIVSEAEFYTLLGFSIQYQAPDFIALAYGEQILFGLQQTDQGASLIFEEHLLWQIGTSSVQGVAALCQQNGIPLLEPVTLQEWGEWTVAVRSPNGYRVIFEGPLSDM